ncbi:hypothetical protein F2Q68_00018183 [Brassica cretica]|uniref:Uncharacterized protein n=1 Tax=Brassica cretica TaxID=69181 RepID=A0A8S9HSZ9_BRACR|nr:hypothetical protein F2Q68_00018183 [Brassica cretica]
MDDRLCFREVMALSSIAIAVFPGSVRSTTMFSSVSLPLLLKLRWICKQKRGECGGVSRMRSRLVDGSSPWKGDWVLREERCVSNSGVCGETSASETDGGFSERR